MSRKLFTFGMFRSGTTLLARLLDTHEEIVCPADPYRPFYNAFRDAVADDIGVDVDPYDPLGDYFADAEQLRLYDAVQDGTLDRPFDRDRAELRRQLIGRSKDTSPFISENLTPDHVSGETFRDVLDDLFAEVPRQYGTGDEAWVGTKDTWATEFLPALRDQYPDGKFLLVVRDPRAVCASKYAWETMYPWLFLARQWRKLTLLTHKYTALAEHDDAHLVRYEDLVRRPEKTVAGITEFLDVAHDERVLNPASYTDGTGDKWLQNTSHDDEDEKAEFNTDSVDKWRETLDAEVVEYIERLCLSEMKLFGYEPEYVSTTGYPDEQIHSPPTEPVESFAEWIKPYYEDRTTVDLVNEMSIEASRHRLLDTSESESERVDDAVIRSQFLERALFRDCRDALARPTEP